MSLTPVLLKAYYELLYDRLESILDPVRQRIPTLLHEEIQRRWAGLPPEKQQAYHEAALAFLVERLEMYNPIGVQYLFDRGDPRDAFELEMSLNWYDPRPEYRRLVQTAHEIASRADNPDQLNILARELLHACDAYPDRSIIRAYEADPALNKLPDYLVARAIEEFLATG